MKHAQRIGWLAILGMSFVVAHAQDDTKKEEPAKEEETAKKVKPFDIDLSIGLNSRSVDNNPHKAFQYGTPPVGFFIRKLALDQNDRTLASVIHLEALGVPGDDYLVSGTLSLFYGDTYISVQNSRNRFWTASPVYMDQSERQIAEFYGRQKFGQNLALSVRHKFSQQDQDFETPRPELHQRTYLNSATLEGSVLGGFGSVGYENWKYYDRTQVLPDTEAKTAQASYGTKVLPGINLEGSVARTDVDVQGRNGNRVDTASVAGLWELTPDTALNFAVSKQWLDLPDTVTGKSLRKNYGFVKLNHHSSKWSAQLGYSSRETDRLRGDGSYVETPRYNTIDAKLYGKLTGNLRLTAKGMWEDLRYGPTTTINSDTSSLWFDRRSAADLKLDWSSLEWTAYTSVSARTNDNRARGVQVRYKNFTVGGTLQALPNLSLYAEHSQDTAAGRVNETMSPDLDTLLPDGRIDVVGLNYTLSSAANLTVDYTDYVTNNDNTLYLAQSNIRGRFLNTALRFNLKGGYRLDLTYSPWHYEDRVFSQGDYDLTVFGIAASGRF